MSKHKECICGADMPKEVEKEICVEVSYWGNVWGNQMYYPNNPLAVSFARANRSENLSYKLLYRIRNGGIAVKRGNRFLSKDGRWVESE